MRVALVKALREAKVTYVKVITTFTERLMTVLRKAAQ